MAARPVPAAVAAERLPKHPYMSKKAIIIFVRHPEWGKVKTRLAKDIGNDAALALYQALLGHTHRTTLLLACDKFVFYTDAIIENDLWSEGGFIKKAQSGNHLGQRMQHAFDTLFAMGYARVLIIGSDCPGITTALLEQSFQTLRTNNAVIGPSYDGGYYLLGLTQPVPGIFEGKQWSTSTVYAETLKDLERNNTAYQVLPVLRDIDTKEDFDAFL